MAQRGKTSTLVVMQPQTLSLNSPPTQRVVARARLGGLYYDYQLEPVAA